MLIRFLMALGQVLGSILGSTSGADAGNGAGKGAGEGSAFGSEIRLPSGTLRFWEAGLAPGASSGAGTGPDIKTKQGKATSLEDHQGPCMHILLMQNKVSCPIGGSI